VLFLVVPFLAEAVFLEELLFFAPLDFLFVGFLVAILSILSPESDVHPIRVSCIVIVHPR
jgi:hypothetical protein